jgi:hypothetical protein
MEKEKRKAIEIPESLYERVETKIKGTDLQSVSDYVVKILRERLASEGNEQAVDYTKEEEEKIKERLRALGYI